MYRLLASSEFPCSSCRVYQIVVQVIILKWYHHYRSAALMIILFSNSAINLNSMSQHPGAISKSSHNSLIFLGKYRLIFLRTKRKDYSFDSAPASHRASADISQRVHLKYEGQFYSHRSCISTITQIYIRNIEGAELEKASLAFNNVFDQVYKYSV